MSDLIFYTNPMSRGQIIRWALHEVGAKYTEEKIEYGPQMKSAPYTDINPMGKVPAISHKGNIVTECAAICTYLADVFPDAELAAKEGELHHYYRWLFFTAGPVESAVMNKGLGFVPNEEQQRTVGYGNYDLVVDVLDDLLTKQDFACGSRFTMADVYLGSQIDWGMMFNTIPSRESFEAYAARFRERAAYKAAKAIDAKLIAEASS